MNETATNVLVYGARYSVYTRIVRLALEVKGVAYRLVEVDICRHDDTHTQYRFGLLPELLTAIAAGEMEDAALSQPFLRLVLGHGPNEPRRLRKAEPRVMVRG